MSKRKHISNDQIRRAVFIHSGNMTLAAEQLGISRRTLYYWVDSDEELEDIRQEAIETRLDIAEEKLQQLIEQDNLIALIFYLKTKGRSRGYGNQPLQAPKDKTKTVISADEQGNYLIHIVG